MLNSYTEITLTDCALPVNRESVIPDRVAEKGESDVEENTKENTENDVNIPASSLEQQPETINF